MAGPGPAPSPAEVDEPVDEARTEPDAPWIVLISSRDPETYRERVRTSPAVAFLSKHELDGTALRSLLGLTAS